jgi:hypothetical protein
MKAPPTLGRVVNAIPKMKGNLQLAGIAAPYLASLLKDAAACSRAISDATL